MRWTIALFPVFLLLYCFLYFRAPSPSSLASFGNISHWLALLFGVVCLIQVTKRTPAADFQKWLYLTLGVFIWLLAQGLSVYSELLLKKAAYGSVADFVWIIGFGFIIRSLFRFASESASKRKLLFWHIGGFIIFLLVIVALIPALKNPERDPRFKLLDVIYTFLEVWTVLLAVLIARNTGDKRPWLVAAIALTVLLISDTIVSYFMDISNPWFRYLDIPVFIGYSSWWLLGALTRPG